MGLLNTMKKVAEGTNNSSVPAAFFFGTVSKTVPLTIRVDNRFDISGDAIILTKEMKEGYYSTHYHKGFEGDPATKKAADHVHELKNNYQTNTDDKSEYYYGLDIGDKVVLFRNYGGQTFLVMGRV